jgi:circadian clock protein KaiC
MSIMAGNEEQHPGGKKAVPASLAGLSLDPTGVPNLDEVLGGGLPRGALTIIVGPPGSGKTTLANQMAFAAARIGRKAMVFTALSEPTSKLIAHLRTFSFFDPEMVGDRVQFLSLQQFLNAGLEATGEEMISTAHKAGAGLVVLDGFRGIQGVDVDQQAARRFLFAVGTTLSTLGTTTIITSEADARDPSFFPEATTADVIIGLYYDLRGVRQWRNVEIIKMRGAAPLQGLHGFGLDRDGIVVFPRLEARIAQDVSTSAEQLTQFPRMPAAPVPRAPFGLPEFDAALNGGLTRGTSTLVVGSLGSGKTFLALHFVLAGAKVGEPSVYVGFRESVGQLLQKTAPFTLGDDLHAALGPEGNLTLLRWPPVELDPNVVAARLLATLDATKARRLVVDSIAEMERGVYDYSPNRVHNYMAALMEALRLRNVTSLFIKEVRQQATLEIDFSDEPISVLAENVIYLRQVDYRGHLHRLISVLKTRFSAHDTSTLREFTIIPPQGIHVMSRLESETGLMTSLAQSELGTGINRPRRGGRSRQRGTKNAGDTGDADETSAEDAP